MGDFVEEIEKLGNMNYCHICNFYFGNINDNNKICPQCNKKALTPEELENDVWNESE